MYENRIVMLLTHLIEKYDNYTQEALNHPKHYKILDNSLIELGKSLNMERLINAADKIKANEIVLPDSFLNGEKTVDLAKESILYLKENNLLGKYKLMAVCHGNNIEEWEKCFNELNNIKEIDVIGIPKVTSSWLVSKNRGELAPIFMKTDKILHFLGSWYNLKELLELDKEVWDKVRSCDTCLPSLYVIQEKTIWEDRVGTINLEQYYPELNKNNYDKIINTFNEETLKLYGNKNWLDNDESYFLLNENYN